jgi:DNA-binding CsgD family transcriptional regulator
MEGFVFHKSLVPGFMLLDSSLRPIAHNAEAVQILAFPTRPDRIKDLPVFLEDRIRTSLLNPQAADSPSFVREYKSGARRYTCSSYELYCNGKTKPQIAVALLLERHASDATALSQVSEQFHLTLRECEIVGLLTEGLTSKEIASRMSISPNTVKAFLRLVMVKMDVSTRSGIVGKIVSRRQ